MRLKHLDDPYDEVESKSFVRLLRQHDLTAWEMLVSTYESYIISVVISTFVVNDLSLNAVEDVSHRIWQQAKRKIVTFKYTEKGCVFVWLCDIRKEIIQVYQDAESPEFFDLLRQRDATAWKQLIKVYNDLLLQAGRSKLAQWGLSPDEAEDFLHETWITARERIGTFDFNARKEGGLFPWLWTIQKNHILNHLRKSRIRNHLSLDDDQSETRVPHSVRSLEEQVEENEMRSQYRKAITRIINETTSEIDRRIVILRFQHYMKPADIMEKYPETVSRVYEVSRSVKIKLKLLLKDYIPHKSVRRGESRQ